LVDFNRARAADGIGDRTRYASSLETREFVEQLQLILRYLSVRMPIWKRAR